MIHIIAAIDRKGAIGKNGDLLFHLRDDLRRFKAITMGNTLVMGRRTFESLPGGALPGRRNIVITRSADFSAPGVDVAKSPEEAIAMAASGPGDIFVIGGGQIYAATLSLADVLDLTVVDREDPEADTHFPTIDLETYRITSLDRREGFYFVTLTKE